MYRIPLVCVRRKPFTYNDKLLSNITMENSRKMISRRDALKGIAAAGAGVLAAPMFNRGRFQLFANSPIEYSARAIDLVRSSTVMDMLCVITLDFAKGNKWMADPESF